MTWTPQNPLDALSKLDRLSMGPDAARHGLLGNVIAQNGTTAETQARGYLYSLLNGGLMSQDEYVAWMRKLIKWEKTNSVVMPPRAVSADHKV
jgi:hypothetical protein